MNPQPIPFEPSAWINDPCLSRCSPAARGIWMDVVCAMWSLNRCGQITGNVRQLSRVCRCSDDEMASAINELEMTGTASVVDCNGIVTLINRRMEREFKERQLNALRQATFRNKRESNAPVTESEDESNSYDTAKQTNQAISDALEPIAKAHIDERPTPKTIQVGEIAQQMDAKRVPKLLAKALRVLGKDCMAFHGSTWRNRAFDNPGKFERVLAEIANMQKEGKAVKSPGGYANTLWNEWA